MVPIREIILLATLAISCSQPINHNEPASKINLFSQPIVIPNLTASETFMPLGRRMMHGSSDRQKNNLGGFYITKENDKSSYKFIRRGPTRRKSGKRVKKIGSENSQENILPKERRLTEIKQTSRNEIDEDFTNIENADGIENRKNMTSFSKNFVTSNGHLSHGQNADNPKENNRKGTNITEGILTKEDNVFPVKQASQNFADFRNCSYSTDSDSRSTKKPFLPSQEAYEPIVQVNHESVTSYYGTVNKKVPNSKEQRLAQQETAYSHEQGWRPLYGASGGWSGTMDFKKPVKTNQSQGKSRNKYKPWKEKFNFPNKKNNVHNIRSCIGICNAVTNKKEKWAEGKVKHDYKFPAKPVRQRVRNNLKGNHYPEKAQKIAANNVLGLGQKPSEHEYNEQHEGEEDDEDILEHLLESFKSAFGIKTKKKRESAKIFGGLEYQWPEF